MQSMGLRSDMMAFKAANPGCELADFIRLAIFCSAITGR
jgi:hypothetical protein